MRKVKQFIKAILLIGNILNPISIAQAACPCTKQINGMASLGQPVDEPFDKSGARDFTGIDGNLKGFLLGHCALLLVLQIGFQIFFETHRMSFCQYHFQNIAYRKCFFP